MDVMLAEAGPDIERLAQDVEGDVAAELRKFVVSGERIRAWFLAHVHKQARPGETPDLLQLKRAMDGWGQAALELFASHP